MTPRTRKYFRRRIQRKYFSLTAITTAIGASRLYAIQEQPLPKYPLGAPSTGGYVFGDGAELVQDKAQSIERLRQQKAYGIAQTVINTASDITAMMDEMQDKTKRYK